MSTVSSAAAAPSACLPVRHGRLSDELLARYAARGSDRAFSVIYERYHQRLYRYCRSIVRNDTDAQDALQSTFTRALAALRREQRGAPLRPWLYRIAHNESITLLRRRKRDAEQQLRAEPRLEEAPADEAAGARARWNALIEDLGTLPERQRGALLLRELAGLSHEEIAVALGVSTGGAKQAIFEARQALSEVEEGRAMSCEAVRHQVSEGDRRILRGRRIRAHLRDCAGCEAFALATDSRRSELRALAPTLPPAAAAAVLARSLSAASPHGVASATAGSATAAAAVGKVATTAVAWKALASAAVLVTAAAGVTGLTHVLTHHHARAGGVRGGSTHLTAERASAATSLARRSYEGAARARAATAHRAMAGSADAVSAGAAARTVTRGESASNPSWLRSEVSHGRNPRSHTGALNPGQGAANRAHPAHGVANRGPAGGATSRSSIAARRRSSGLGTSHASSTASHAPRSATTQAAFNATHAATLVQAAGSGVERAGNVVGHAPGQGLPTNP